MGRLSANLSNLEHSMQSAHLRQLPRRGSREKTCCPLRGKCHLQVTKGVYFVALPLGLRRFVANAPPQSPPAPAPPVGEPRFLSCHPEGGAENISLPPPGEVPPSGGKGGVFCGIATGAPPLRGKCTPSAFGSSPSGGAEILKLPPRGGAKGFYYQNRYLMPALAFHCIS